MNYAVMTERETEIELNTSASEGLESFTAHDRLIDNGRNTPERSYAKSALSAVLAQFGNLYTVAFVIMGTIAALFDFENGVAAMTIFFAVAALNAVCGFLRDNKDRKAALEFDRKRGSDVKIVRDGKTMFSDPTLLVKGDIVVLEEGDFVPADLRILKCEALKADESIFRGRWVPQDKVSEKAPEGVDEANAPNMLYCGSTVACGSAVGAVVATGKDTTLARMMENKARKMNMHNKFAKSAASEKLLVCTALAAATAVVCFDCAVNRDFDAAMMKACATALCVLPAPIAIVRMIALSYAKTKTERAGAEVTGENPTYEIGGSEYLLFDKGGVLTSGELELEERMFSGTDKAEMAVICTDCTFVNDSVRGNAIDRATVLGLEADGLDVRRIAEDNEKVMFMPFDEHRKLMAVLVKRGEGYRLIVKGSMDVVPTLCINVADGDDLVEMNGQIMLQLETTSSSMAERGLKIRALAYRDIDSVPENIEDEIKSMTFAGVLAYREIVAKNAREAVRKTEKVNIKPIMVTSDLTITAYAIARTAGLVKSERQCVSFRELGDCSDRELLNAADKYRVFTCATREDRERLVKVLAQNGRGTIVAGERMTETTVAINATASIGVDESCDVKLNKNGITGIAEAVSNFGTARANMASAALLAIGTGIGEMLFMLFSIFTRAEKIAGAYEMLLTNLFIVFVPCLAAALFGEVCFDVKNRRSLALKAPARGFVTAVAAVMNPGAQLLFFVYYALADASRVCFAFGNEKKSTKTILTFALLIACLAAVTIAAGVGAKCATRALMCAFAATIVNAVTDNIVLKGRHISDV